MESERKWKLGEDIDRHDNLLDGISFDRSEEHTSELQSL